VNKFNGHVDQFRAYLQQIGYSEGSIKMLPHLLKDFLCFSNKLIQLLTSNDILRYYEHLKLRPNKIKSGLLSESYISHHIYSLKLFFAWQQEIGFIEENPMSVLSFKSPKSKRREILSLSEIKQLYKVTRSYKERAVLSIFYGCGLRRSEGEALNLKDIFFGKDLLIVRKGKGNKRRAVPMSSGVKSDIENYVLKGRISTNEHLITNKVGKRMSGDSYNAALKKMLSRTTITKPITLHCLRHSIASHLLESGLSVEYVRDFLGHKHLESTQVYTHVKKEQLWNLQSKS